MAGELVRSRVIRDPLAVLDTATAWKQATGEKAGSHPDVRIARADPAQQSEAISMLKTWWAARGSNPGHPD